MIAFIHQNVRVTDREIRYKQQTDTRNMQLLLVLRE